MLGSAEIGEFDLRKRELRNRLIRVGTYTRMLTYERRSEIMMKLTDRALGRIPAGRKRR